MTIGRHLGRFCGLRAWAAVAALIGALAAVAPAGASAAAAVPPQRTLYRDAPNGMFLLGSGWAVRTGTGRFRPVSVPHAFNAGDFSRSSFRGGVRWYRNHFTLPSTAGATGWRLRFESVNLEATVWLNGRLLGRHRGAELPFELSAGSIRRGSNELLVRVDSRAGPNDLPPADRARGWWNSGGILREVYLRRVGRFDLTGLQVRAPGGVPSTVRVSATIRNTGRVAADPATDLAVTGPGGFAYAGAKRHGTLAPGRSRRVTLTFTIPRPALWSPRSPSLYDLTLRVPGGQEHRTHFGVRSWTVRGDGRILLNGSPITLRGASFHEQVPGRGAALTQADRDQLVAELRSLGANATRQHYPPHPALLEAFDRAGIVYWSQIPVWRVRETQLRRVSFRRVALATLRQTIERDRNHASVLAWSVANETLRGGAGEAAYLRSARRVVRRLDPTRLFAVDKSLRPLDDFPASYEMLDAIGINEYVGWYGGSTFELPSDLEDVHDRFPRQALVVTEFGAEANRAGPMETKGTYAFQQDHLSRHLQIFDATRYLSGALVWALRDFPVRPGWHGGNPEPRPPFLFKGLFGWTGTPKPAAETVRGHFARALARG